MLNCSRCLRTRLSTFSRCSTRPVHWEMVPLFEEAMSLSASSVTIRGLLSPLSFYWIDKNPAKGEAKCLKTFHASVRCFFSPCRKHDVSSGLLRPTWTPFSGSKDSEESLYFSLQLMTGRSFFFFFFFVISHNPDVFTNFFTLNSKCKYWNCALFK